MRLGWDVAADGTTRGLGTLPPAVAACAAALMLIVSARRRGGPGAAATASSMLPALYVTGLCVSMLIIAGGGQHLEDLQHRFVGIDVAVDPDRAAWAAPALLMVAAVVALLWRRWLLLAQAPAAAELAGLHPARWDAAFLSLLATVVLLGTDSLGGVMVLAMLFLPAAAVLPWARRLPVAMAASAGVSLVILAVGFYLSNSRNWPLSQSVGGAGFVVFVLSQAIARVMSRA